MVGTQRLRYLSEVYFQGPAGDGLLQPYYGRMDKSEDDYVITYENKDKFYWEVITIDTAKLDKKKWVIEISMQ